METEKLQLAQGTALRVDWDDAKSLMGWQYKYDSPERIPGRIKSIGFLINVNKEALTISTSMGHNRASLDDLSIPIGCVTDVKVLPPEYSFDGEKNDGNDLSVLQP